LQEEDSDRFAVDATKIVAAVPGQVVAKEETILAGNSIPETCAASPASNDHTPLGDVIAFPVFCYSV
jgi:hypothetical protein